MLACKDEDGITIVNFLVDEIFDEADANYIGEQLFDLVRPHRKKFLISLKNVQDLSSSFLAKLAALNKIVQKNGGVFVLCNIDERVYEKFSITQLNKILKIAKDEKEAKEVLEKS